MTMPNGKRRTFLAVLLALVVLAPVAVAQCKPSQGPILYGVSAQDDKFAEISIRCGTVLKAGKLSELEGAKDVIPPQPINFERWRAWEIRYSRSLHRLFLTTPRPDSFISSDDDAPAQLVALEPRSMRVLAVHPLPGDVFSCGFALKPQSSSIYTICPGSLWVLDGTSLRELQRFKVPESWRPVVPQNFASVLDGMIENTLGNGVQLQNGSVARIHDSDVPKATGFGSCQKLESNIQDVEAGAKLVKRTGCGKVRFDVVSRLTGSVLGTIEASPVQRARLTPDGKFLFVFEGAVKHFPRVGKDFYLPPLWRWNGNVRRCTATGACEHWKDFGPVGENCTIAFVGGEDWFLFSQPKAYYLATMTGAPPKRLDVNLPFPLLGSPFDFSANWAYAVEP